jgi:hypothetical protein
VIEACFTPRGLVSLELMLQVLPKRGTISFPDFICDEVVALLRRYFEPAGMRPYRVRADLTADTATVTHSDVLYTVDYFGRENGLIAPYVTAHIRDAVWMPYPERRLDENEWWFTSFRKFAWPAHGSMALTTPELNDSALRGPPEPNGIAEAMAANGIAERRLRSANYDILDEVLFDYGGVDNFSPQFCSVYPLIVPNRDQVVAKLAAQGIQLPGMWKNAHGFPNDLYRTLVLIPCDSRFTVAEIEWRAQLVREAIEG